MLRGFFVTLGEMATWIKPSCNAGSPNHPWVTCRLTFPLAPPKTLSGRMHRYSLATLVWARLTNMSAYCEPSAPVTPEAPIARLLQGILYSTYMAFLAGGGPTSKLKVGPSESPLAAYNSGIDSLVVNLFCWFVNFRLSCFCSPVHTKTSPLLSRKQ